MVFYFIMPPKTSYILNLGWHFFVRDFKIRYRRAIFGFFWALAPILSLGSAIVLIGTQMKAEPNTGFPYAPQVFIGLIVFGVFFDAVTIPQQLARKSRNLLSRFPFPHEALLVAGTLYVVLNFLMRVPVLIFLFILYSIPLKATLILAALALPLLLCLGLCLGCLLTPPSLIVLDIRYSMPLLQSMLFLATPLFYPTPDSGTIHFLNTLNPLTYLILSIRDWIMTGNSAYGGGTIALILPILVSCALAIRFYKRAMPIGASQI